jgi:hypothetical protein
VSCAKWYHATCLAPAAESRAATHAIVAGGRWVCPPCRPLAPALPNVDFNAGASADAPGVPDADNAPAAAVDAQCFARFPTGAPALRRRWRCRRRSRVHQHTARPACAAPPQYVLARRRRCRQAGSSDATSSSLGSGSSAGMHARRRRCWGDSGVGATPLSGLHACSAALRGAASRVSDPRSRPANVKLQCY